MFKVVFVYELYDMKFIREGMYSVTFIFDVFLDKSFLILVLLLFFIGIFNCYYIGN